MSIQRLQCSSRMSQAVIANGFVFLAGQVAGNTDDNVAGQTRQILARIDALLAEAGTDKTRIVSASIWLADHKTFNEMNEVWDAWVPPGAAPARACVESALAFPPYTVEIAVIAVA
ncbi:RidA family protein [Bordetella sp. 2513F-2]